MKTQVKFVLFILGVLFVASGVVAVVCLYESPINWLGFGFSLCIAFVFYIGFVNTLMEVE